MAQLSWRQASKEFVCLCHEARLSHHEFGQAVGLHSFGEHQLFHSEVRIVFLEEVHCHLVVVGLYVAKFGARLACLCQCGLYLHDVGHGLIGSLAVATDGEHAHNELFVGFAYGLCGFVVVEIILLLT